MCVCKEGGEEGEVIQQTYISDIITMAQCGLGCTLIVSWPGFKVGYKKTIWCTHIVSWPGFEAGYKKTICYICLASSKTRIKFMG